MAQNVIREDTPVLDKFVLITRDQQLYTCRVCGAAVPSAARWIHLTFHEAVANAHTEQNF